MPQTPGQRNCFKEVTGSDFATQARALSKTKSVLPLGLTCIVLSILATLQIDIYKFNLINFMKMF